MKHSPSRGTCEDCGKQLWATRRDARQAARRIHPGEALHTYLCPHGNGGHHIGHLPAAIVRGRVTRDVVYRKKKTA
jgi:hypothetical protein